jgi:opacity protein-like surface antigen
MSGGIRLVKKIAMATLACLPLCAALPAAAMDGLTPYLRGDLGLSVSRSSGGNPATGTGFGSDYGQAGSFGLGGGVALTGLPLRFDATLAYRSGYEINSTASIPSSAGPLALTGRGSLSQWLAMATAYVDIPVSLGGIQPFIGASAGYAWNQLGSFTTGIGGIEITEAPKTTGNFAWGLTAGVTMPVTPRFRIDAAYRYLDAGDVKTSGQTAFGPSTPITGKLAADEFVLSFRYSF